MEVNIYKVLDLEDEVHSIWVYEQAAFKNARVILIFKVGRNGHGARASSR